MRKDHREGRPMKRQVEHPSLIGTYWSYYDVYI
jgi:hypothetical protein